MSSRKPEDLTKEMRLLYEKFMYKMIEAKIPYIVTCTARDVKEQVALYSQGRQPIEEVNTLRVMAKMPPITDKENVKVTWTMASKHIVNLDDGNTANDKARAFDIVITKNNKPTWDIKVNVNGNEIPDYTESGKIGESVGLKWGGRFKSPDFPHFEMP